ncbi:MAG: hypothetical protein CO141_03850 [Candidatus Moranbacteria bacterium CG_4_9_14_3_um_filter_42_9]|nr:MAG: hypothetical protein CO141_03850 [Candidatus Moranbacteria bacterium CG_4_9_14_3_um_filter_42_9]
MKTKILFTSAFFLGLILLGINISGFFIPLRSERLLEETAYGHKTDDQIDLSADEALQILEYSGGISEEDTIKTGTETVEKAILHYWDDELADEFGLRVPMHENWILWGGSHIMPQYFRKYEFCHYWEKGIERGVGWCSQSSSILAQYLRKRDVNADIYVMYGHVVVIAGTLRHVADPDYGVYLPFTIEEIESDPEMIRPYYADAGYSAEEIGIAVRAFDPNAEKLIAPDFVRYSDYCALRHRIFEQVVYILKWLIPILFIAPLVYSAYRRNNLEHIRSN